MLSICAICKNESKNIVPFLNSWLPICDELILVDTGSTDNTIKLAIEQKIPREKLKIVRSEWHNDFSYARNLSINNCQGDWIMWADLDDRFDNPSLDKLKEITDNAPSNKAYAFQIASDVGNGHWSRFLQVRLFPNNKNIEFNGRIHETLIESLTKNCIEVEYQSEIIIAHLGYADMVLRQEKAVRNLELLTMEDIETPEPMIQCGDCFCVLGHFETAVSCYKQAIDISMSPSQTRGLLAEKIVKSLMAVGKVEEAANEVQHIESDTVERYYWMAEIAAFKGDKDMARLFYLQAKTGNCVMGEQSSNAGFYIETANRKYLELKGG